MCAYGRSMEPEEHVVGVGGCRGRGEDQWESSLSMSCQLFAARNCGPLYFDISVSVFGALVARTFSGDFGIKINRCPFIAVCMGHKTQYTHTHTHIQQTLGEMHRNANVLSLFVGRVYIFHQHIFNRFLVHIITVFEILVSISRAAFAEIPCYALKHRPHRCSLFTHRNGSQQLNSECSKTPECSCHCNAICVCMLCVGLRL